MDSSDLDRLGKGKSLLERSKEVLNIDHHITNTKYGDVNLVIANASSTGEISYDLIKALGIQVDKEIGANIYTAISTDTGRFMYSNTSSKTHKIVADLLEQGLDTNSININLYQSRSFEKTNLLISSLNSLQFFSDNKIGIIKVTQEMLKENKASMEDTEGIVSFVQNIDGVEVACMFKEFATNEIKVSLRSKRYFDVSKLSSKFGGGGHVRASGFTIYSDMANTIDIVVDEILRELG